MKLNHDCVRSILLELEEKLPLGQQWQYPRLKELDTFNKYGEDTSIYAISKLLEAGFLTGKCQFSQGYIVILRVSEITFTGHEFLDNIKDSQVWSRTKDVAKKVSSASISIMSDLAVDMVKKQLGLV